MVTRWSRDIVKYLSWQWFGFFVRNVFQWKIRGEGSPGAYL